ncbi:HAD family hydrolase [Thermofilum pendens]|uniref:HAD family hydrolase n=1 Tax=Thermofilum pendens TaxID=2269 RepID=UPI00069BB31F|nr:HAD family hydrolase [Thermofilum pendens]
MKVRVVSLDLDGTVVSREYVDYFWLELVPRLYARRHGLNLEEAKRLVYSAYDEVGPGDMRWYQPSYWFKRFGIEEWLGDALREAGRLVRVYEDARRFLESLPGSLIAVLSTSASREFVELVMEREPFLRGVFRRVFSSSSDYSLPGKPPEFFRIILRELGARPEEVVHVGDDPVHDYENPRKAGLRAYLLSRSGGDGIRGLDELLAVLEA